MAWRQIALFDAEDNLFELDQVLRKRGIPHRITEELKGQALWVPPSVADGDVFQVIEALRKGQLESLPASDGEPHTAPAGQPGSLLVWQQQRITISLCALSIVIYLLTHVVYVGPLVDFLRSTTLDNTLGEWQLWRALTPAFLHFSIMHIVFNLLWIWEFGKKLELVLGPRRYLLLFLLCAVAANVQQYLVLPNQQNVSFGGLSGVVYGYLGFLWMAKGASNDKRLFIPPGIIVFMLAWLGLGFMGVIDMFVSGSIANGAHLGGLVMGMVLGRGYCYWEKRKGSRL